MSQLSPHCNIKSWLGQPLSLVMPSRSVRTISQLPICGSAEAKVSSFALWWWSHWAAGAMMQFLSFKELATCWVRDLHMVFLQTFVQNNYFKNSLVGKCYSSAQETPSWSPCSRPSLLTFCFFHCFFSLTPVCHFIFRNLLLQQKITFHNMHWQKKQINKGHAS